MDPWLYLTLQKKRAQTLTILACPDLCYNPVDSQSRTLSNVLKKQMCFSFWQDKTSKFELLLRLWLRVMGRSELYSRQTMFKMDSVYTSVNCTVNIELGTTIKLVSQHLFLFSTIHDEIRQKKSLRSWKRFITWGPFLSNLWDCFW